MQRNWIRTKQKSPYPDGYLDIGDILIDIEWYPNDRDVLKQVRRDMADKLRRCNAELREAFYGFRAQGGETAEEWRQWIGAKYTHRRGKKHLCIAVNNQKRSLPRVKLLRNPNGDEAA